MAMALEDSLYWALITDDVYRGKERRAVVKRQVVSVVWLAGAKTLAVEGNVVGRAVVLRRATA